MLLLLLLAPLSLAAESDARQLGVALGNVSLVITYTSMVVAALMIGSFLWIAVSYSGSRAGHGYAYDRDDEYYDYDYDYRRRSLNTPGLYHRIPTLISHCD